MPIRLSRGASAPVFGMRWQLIIYLPETSLVTEFLFFWRRIAFNRQLQFFMVLRIGFERLSGSDGVPALPQTGRAAFRSHWMREDTLVREQYRNQ